MTGISQVKDYPYNSLINVSSFVNMEFFLSSLTLWLLAGTVLVPHLEIGGISIGLDDASAIVLIIAFVGYFLLKPKNLFLRRDGLLITGLWVCLIFTGVIFSVIGGLFYIDEFRLPSEMWQYVKRMLFFCCTCYVSYRSLISSRNFCRCLNYVLMVAFFIGILQVFPGSIGNHLASLYARTEGQLACAENPFAYLRNYGVAGFSTAWGGFAVFGVAVSLGGLLAGREAQVKRRFYSFKLWLLLVLALINILFSGSRAAIAALLAVYILAVLLGVIYMRRKLRFLLYYVGGFVLVSGWFTYAFWNKLLFLVFRFGALIDQSGGNRVEQVKAGLSLLRNSKDWLFGVGNATQRALATSFGTEVEPAYLLVNYGILGVVLRYGLLLVIFIYAWRQIKSAAQNDRDLAIATILSLAGYFVFSFGYFFFQELYVGMLPWLIFGWVVGSFYRDSHLRLCGASVATPSFREVLQ
ncbi:conserved membrane hypothetical protein [uncultured Desulfobacterium sp.]|uniref:O-antigen ligase-related domain-containing protein n=1 Tax=uncultured Desulfobacterium sp. TaxID=201089 RepID=A0A445MYM1_9BACT|nr:conserved membrane hypothetical protein [uncultured Desulfobacterium sp.]